MRKSYTVLNSLISNIRIEKNNKLDTELVENIKSDSKIKNLESLLDNNYIISENWETYITYYYKDIDQNISTTLNNLYKKNIFKDEQIKELVINLIYQQLRTLIIPKKTIASDSLGSASPLKLMPPPPAARPKAARPKAASSKAGPSKVPPSTKAGPSERSAFESPF